MRTVQQILEEIFHPDLFKSPPGHSLMIVCDECDATGCDKCVNGIIPLSNYDNKEEPVDIPALKSPKETV